LEEKITLNDHQFLTSTTETQSARFQWNMASTDRRNCMHDCLYRRLKHYLWLSKRLYLCSYFYVNFRRNNLSE